MSNSLKALLGATAHTEEGDFPIIELFYRPEDRRLRYAAIDIGGWLDHREVLVSLDRFGALDGESWPVHLDREGLEAAPRWLDAPSEPSILPPIVVGPFGSTFSPLLMEAQLLESAEESQPQETSALDGRSRILDMDRASPWIGTDAFDDTGRLGEIADVMLSDELVFISVLLDDERELSLDRLRRRADQGHLLFD
ncbi:hypothetical protein LX81_00590 [Palleronia aestuarii]|uniref:PRC-barrel domain protein n=1 Tax=Palleronia aestuarii TaxID=568105 RepID=A0A2W7NLB3_9RHOB|nr:hypothetical protein [Palleronia aestuarii]PZX18897.1 hypothetical protein LX81_00590 [Palleronia aestuarii]